MRYAIAVKRTNTMRYAIALILSIGFMHAATTAVTSITCSGQTATVNSTAHGLAAKQGFSLSGSSATFNSTTSAVTTNAFTFVLPAGTVCSGFTLGYTAVGPAKQIIKLSSTPNVADGTVTFSYIEWFTTTTPVVVPGAVSIWSGASAAENAAIAAGTTVETSGTLTVPATTALTTVETTVTGQYTAIQSAYATSLTAGNGFWWSGGSATNWVNQ